MSKTKFYATFGGAKPSWEFGCERIVAAAKHWNYTPLVFDDRHILRKHSDFIDSRADIFMEHPKSEKPSTHWREVNDRRFTRGFGWFCWKPYIILQAFQRMNDGDIVLYSDADVFPICDPDPLFKQCEDEGGIMLFAACGFSQRHWCKRDCNIVMGMDEDKWRDKQHAVARFMLFQKGAGHETLLKQWLNYASDIRCTTFEKSTLAPEYPDLQQHRCEQAILTNLAHKNNIPLHREADECGNPCLSQ